MSDIFREIEDELRRENLRQLWKRYGKYIIVLAVAAVVATAAVMGWRAYQNKQRAARGVEYAAALALVRANKPADAASAFAKLASESDSGRAVLARLEEASAKLDAGDTPGAIAIYDRLAADGSIDPKFRDAATILAARYTLDKGDVKAVIAKLKPLTVATSPWHGLAQELTALAELQAGDKTKARQDFKALAGDAAVSPDIRQRAQAMTETLAP